MKKKRKLGRKLLSFLLTLTMLVGLMPGMSLTAYAEGEATPTAAETLAPTVDSNNKVTGAKVLEYAGKKWYVIASGTTGVQIANGAVTSQTGETTLVLLAKEDWRPKSYGLKFYDGNGSSSAYGSSNLKTTIDSLVTSEKIGNYYTSEDETWKNNLVAKRTLAGGAGFSSDWASVDNINGNTVTGATLWPLSANEASQIKNSTILTGSWWLRSPGKEDGNAAAVYNGSLTEIYVNNLNYGVRPALCLNLTSDIFVFKKSDGVYELTNHNHNFTYLSDGATITATCTATGCTNPAVSATLTINAPTLSTYGGTESKTATLTGLDAFNSATGKTIATTDIKYIGRDGTTYGESGVAPTDAGKYTAKITVEGKTARVDYEIAKTNPTTPTGLTATYGQTLANVTLPAGWTWADSTQNVGNVVDPAATFKANFAGDNNYNAASDVDVTVTVGKADPTAPTGLTATYGQTLADVTLPDGWTWADSTQSVGNVVDPAATFKANFAGDDNHNAASDVDVTVTVGKANAVPATVIANNRTYDGTEKPLVTVTGETTGGTLKFAVTTEDQEPAADAYNLDTTSIPTATDAGTYYVWYKAVGNENYNDSKADVLTVTIKSSVTITFDSNGGSEVDPQVIDKGGKAEEPEEPTNGKLAFIGWFIDPTMENLYDFDNDKINSFDFSSAIEKDTKLTAVWTAFARVNTIGTGKVNYAYEGEEKDDEYDDSIILSAIQGMADTFILTAKADEGSRFVKWQKVIEEGETLEDSKFEDYSEDEEITITITEPISLVAVFETIDEDDKVYSSYESDTEWTKGSGKSLKVGAKGSEDDDETINHFKGLKGDGKAIANKYYTAKKGSVKIEIDPEYLETLEVGKHVLTLMFDDADDVEITFTVLAAKEETSKDAKVDVDDKSKASNDTSTDKATESKNDKVANTGDNAQPLLALFVMIDAALALNYVLLRKRRDKRN